MTAKITTQKADDLRGYDSIIGISQNTINSQFCNLCKLGLIELEINEENDKGSIKGKLSAPTVTLQIKNEGKVQEITMNIGFRRGELKLKDGPTFPLENVLLGFNALIETNVVKKSDLLASANVTQEVKNTFQNLDESFAIQYLYINLKRSIIPDNLTSIEGIRNFAALNVLVNLIAQHYELEGALSPFGIGFQPTHRAGLALEDANSIPTIPSLVPTSVDYSLTLNTKQPDWSTFNFLMMTGNRPAPTPKLYVDLQMVDSNELHGRYLAAERLVLQDGLLRSFQNKFETTAPFTWNEQRKRWHLKSEIQVKREEHMIGSSKVVIILKAYPQCWVDIPRQKIPIRVDLNFDIMMEATFTVDGNRGDLSPLEMQAQFGGNWEISLRDEQLYLEGKIVQLPEYESNNNWERIYKPEWNQLSPTWRAVRTALGAFGGGSWVVFKGFIDTLQTKGYLNMGSAVLPLGRKFEYRDAMINGVKNSNLQVDLTIKT